MAKKLVVIDTDCGIDDAQAIMMALAAPHIQVLGVTCVFGNAAVESVCQNVLRVLSVCECEGIPVFGGSAAPLVGSSNSLSDHFGGDGLGDVIKDKVPQWEQKIQKEHAVNAMIRLVSENQEQVSLVALGPLTNLALAVRLDPHFPKKLRDLYIMGGNMEGKGNMTPCAEFNFVMDPESAYIVLEEYLCPTYIASWEYSCRNSLTWEFFEELVNQDAAAARFMKMITSKCWAYSKEAMVNKRDVYFGPGFVSYDAYAMAACVDGSLVTESIKCPVRVELQGSIARGMMVLDQTNQLKKSHSVFVLTKCDAAKFSQLLMESLRQPCKK
ncbi:inosine-uridine preferring nucleoside hydrolase [Parambassis ranga]|uniref:Inosine-uridine preferring nucleoside hydrolase-like n=1 Tax=Parambassis ranga TaxID=210632 RepID=A0A6P7I8R1_9TELE|nr:inosine-uridine preferring nucleoside hydrolase-like [Parambassis ranga]XP_028259286.1 inosine-uridine preferring nucleoside hydrolase-like [Parambassis ranga]XP_028259287.1 inosine-uridine preferring nucleoside hydrolase-like [Parambassis ranga]XP_028259288.1 inosine-uridine preferring nucleoside hydrolase-like [Parambassis ranga]